MERTSSMAIKFAWIRACVKAGLPDDPNHPRIIKNVSPKKESNYGNCVECASGLGR